MVFLSAAESVAQCAIAAQPGRAQSIAGVAGTASGSVFSALQPKTIDSGIRSAHPSGRENPPDDTPSRAGGVDSGSNAVKLGIETMRTVLRSKIHHASVTEANLDYVGSITIDQDLIDAVGLWPNEKVLVVSNTSGVRLETYVIPGEAGSGIIGVNGAAAHLITAGEKVIIMGFESTDKPIDPKVVLVDADNRIVRHLSEEPQTSVASLAN